MSEQDIMSDKRVLEIITKKEGITNKELDALLYRLLDSGDNNDDLQRSLTKYTNIDAGTYDTRMIHILQYICSSLDLNFDIYECKYITKDVIKEKVDVLPEFRLIEFIQASVENYFVAIDYENYDTVYACDYLLEILEDSSFKNIINDEELISQEDIENIIYFIWNLDLFDVEKYKLYNE